MAARARSVRQTNGVGRLAVVKLSIRRALRGLELETSQRAKAGPRVSGCLQRQLNLALPSINYRCMCCKARGEAI
jgi:hypothetical protein